MEGTRTLSLNLVSAKVFKKPTFTRRMNVYAVASISGTTCEAQKIRTSVAKNTDSDPTWNFPMQFLIDEAAALQNHLTLVMKIKRVGFFGVKNVGEVCVPVKELLDGVKADGKPMHSVSYQMRSGASGKPKKGALSFTYAFGEKISERVVVGSISAGYPQQSYMMADGCYPSTPPHAYDTYPPQPLRSSMKFGLLGGGGAMLLEEIASHAA